MCRRVSEASASPRTGASFGRQPGFTLIEVVIGMVVSGLLVLVVTRFFNDSHRAYNLQERLADRDANAQYVVKRLEERIMEAGANLPESGWPVIKPGANPTAGFSLVLNPRGGTQTFYSDVAATLVVPIDDEAQFRNASAVLILRGDKSVQKVDIATGYNIGGWSKGLKKGTSGQDTVRLSAPVAFQAGDALYAFSNEDYAVAGTDLSMGGMVLAENIEAVSLNFYDSTGSATSDWNLMHSAKVSVTARTHLPDPDYQGDGYRRVTINSEIRLRNRP
jgi:prepilin-type N-terminal cleavage/methylation domain-containing protein